MCGAVFTYDAAAVQCKSHRQRFKADIVNNLIVCTLQKG